MRKAIICVTTVFLYVGINAKVFAATDLAPVGSNGESADWSKGVDLKPVGSYSNTDWGKPDLMPVGNYGSSAQNQSTDSGVLVSQANGAQNHAAPNSM